MRSKRRCDKGHTYYKSSACLVCPICENMKPMVSEWHNNFAAPARRALEREGLIQLESLSEFSKEEFLQLHGIGKNAVNIADKLLNEVGLKFR